MRLYAVMLFLHVLAVVVWVGGMFVMHFAVRPAAAELLPPPQRLPMMAGALARFLRWALVAVVVAILSGFAMILGIGAAAGAMAAGKNALLEGLRVAHSSVHLMTALGLAMTVVYALVRWAAFPALQRAVAAGDWAAAAVALGRVRGFIAFNLVLGVLTIAVATIGRAVI